MSSQQHNRDSDIHQDNNDAIPIAEESETNINNNTESVRHQSELPRGWLQRCAKLRPLREESHSHFVLRVGTANLKGMHLTQVPNELRALRNLRMLYLYDNFLSRVNNLDRNRRLQALYLDNNHLTTLQGIGTLPLLNKLCANNNCISLIDGLEGCHNLQELHVSDQRLQAHFAGVQFDGFTIDSLAQCLTTLVCCNNRVTEVSDLTALRRLEVLTFDNNLICDIEVVKEICTDCYSMRELSLVGNPVVRVHGYRDAAILASDLMTTLDGKVVPANQREFLQARAMRRQNSQHRAASSRPTSNDSLSKPQQDHARVNLNSRGSISGHSTSRDGVVFLAAAQPTARFNMTKRVADTNTRGVHVKKSAHKRGTRDVQVDQLSNAVAGTQVQAQSLMHPLQRTNARRNVDNTERSSNQILTNSTSNSNNLSFSGRSAGRKGMVGYFKHSVGREPKDRSSDGRVEAPLAPENMSTELQLGLRGMRKSIGGGGSGNKGIQTRAPVSGLGGRVKMQDTFGSQAPAEGGRTSSTNGLWKQVFQGHQAHCLR